VEGLGELEELQRGEEAKGTERVWSGVGAMSESSAEVSPGLQYGMLNMMRTGNPFMDMVLAMMVPMVLNLVLNGWQSTIHPKLEEAWGWLMDLISGRAVAYERTVTHDDKDSRMCSQDDERNKILVKAIRLYLGQLAKKQKFTKATTSLMAIREIGAFNNQQWEWEYGTTAEQLNCYSLNDLPAPNEWTDLEDDIKFMHNTSVENEGQNEGKVTQSKKVHYTFQSFRPDGAKHINDYLNKIFEWYKVEIDKNSDSTTRYMYVLSNEDAKDSDDDNDAGALPARRYKLQMRKTFDTLFFPEKEGMLGLVQAFLDKSGRYAIPGFPSKLGLLLYGSPGTGKTSVIKALAHRTNRHIVQVPLGKIKTNQTLIDLMYQTRFKVSGEDMPISLKQSDCIFVFEDVDCCSNIVKRRDGGKSSGGDTVVLGTDSLDSPLEGTGKRGKGAEEDESCTASSSNSDAGVVELPDTYEEPGAAVDILSALFSQMGGGGKGDGDAIAGPITKSSFYAKSDKLTLAGLLNALDGPLDAEDRIVIMTTNHPEQLDPALIRPGRIDRKIHLTYCQHEAVCSMIKLYYGSCSAANRKLVKEMFSDERFRVTPASLEGLAAEVDGENEYVEKLREVHMKLE